MKDHELNTDLK